MDYAPMITLEGVDGSRWALSSPGEVGNIWLERGQAKGLDMPVYDVQSDRFPNIPGTVPRSARADSREIFLPITIYGSNRPEMVATKRRFLRALPPTRFSTRMARLMVAESDGKGNFEQPRYVEVYYDSGMEGDEGSDNGLHWGKFGLILQATNPYFKSIEDVRIPFASYENQEAFFPPGMEPFVSPDGLTGGFKLSPDPVFTTEIQVTNSGDEPAYPTFEFVGPIEGPFNLVRSATADSPEQSLIVSSLSLEIGEKVTLVTEPGRVSISPSAGVDAVWANLAVNPQFWALDPGANEVRIDGLDPEIEPTSVVLSFRPAYLGM